jgi:hypothetical protein
MRVAKRIRCCCRISGRTWVPARRSRRGGSGASDPNTRSNISDNFQRQPWASCQKASLSIRPWHKQPLASCPAHLHQVHRVRSTTMVLHHQVGCLPLMARASCLLRDTCTRLPNNLGTMLVTCPRRDRWCLLRQSHSTQPWHHNNPSHLWALRLYSLKHRNPSTPRQA